MVDRISRLHQSGLVEVRWLTTWSDEEITEWNRVGLGPFASPDREVDGPFSWRKANAVHEFLVSNPARPVVWTDDDIDVNTHRANRIRQAGGDRLLTVSPDRDQGLTVAELARIESWLRGQISRVG